MNRIVLLSTFFSVLTLFTLFSQDNNLTSYTITNYGIITASNNDETIKNNKDNVTKKINIINNDSYVLSTAEVITAELNANFGIEFICHTENTNDPINIVYRYYHPKITNPKTKNSSIVESLPCKITPNEKHIMGWKFNEDWEIVKGKWIFQIIENDKVVLEKTFITE